MADNQLDLAAKAFKASANYEEARPTYSVESVRFLLEKVGVLEEKEMKSQPRTILELGCGTGKFTRILMEVLKDTDTRVIATDPLENMLKEFRKIFPNFEVEQSSAENIAFPDSSVDVVLAAHCFHWFANEEAVKEIYRVLTPQGTLGMIWALPDESVPWLKEMMTFFHPLEEDFKYTISKETMDKVFEEVGKLFTIEKESGKKTSWHLSYDGCYNYFVSKGIIQRGTDEVKCQFKTWFDYIIGIKRVLEE